jgi:hypothetical protein
LENKMLVISDRVKESSLTTGTGPVVLRFPIGAFQSFGTGIGDGNSTYYCIENGRRWEVGRGTYTQSTNSLSRDIIFDSSSSGSKINLDGPSIVFCTLPADKAIFKDDFGGTYVSTIGASGISTENLSVGDSSSFGGPASFGDSVVVSGDLSLLGDFIFNGDLNNINNISSTGDIISSGFLTLVRPDSAGNFLHAYKNDSQKQTVALYVDNNLSPLWRFGLKLNPDSKTAPPTFAYVFARDGSAGVVSNTNNYFSLADGNGFIAHHNSNTVFRASSSTGVYVRTSSSSQPSFVITAPPLANQHMQRWNRSDEVTLSVVDSGGRFGILRSNPQYELDVNGSGRMAVNHVTSGVSFPDGSFQTTAYLTSTVQNRPYSNITSNFSVPSSGSVVFADSTVNAINVYIPTAVNAGGKEITVKRVAGNLPVTVMASGSEKIDGNSSFTLHGLYESATLISNNLNWFII